MLVVTKGCSAVEWRRNDALCLCSECCVLRATCSSVGEERGEKVRASKKHERKKMVTSF